MNCDCVNEQQDKIHGKNRRVHNINAKEEYGCTVCSKVKGGGEKKSK